MPIRIRWLSKDYVGVALMLFGACGLFQAIFILIGQVFLGVTNYFVMILIPIGIIIAIFYGTVIIFEGYAQVRRREKLRSQFKGRTEKNAFKKFLHFPITKPILIMSSVFALFFFILYLILNIFLEGQLAFVISEISAAILFLFIANGIERYLY
ncbi:MAG: conserved membrane protein of unknown function [Promethearchaeota archaeon]|nr:MAG: conserved membrane protein of unknown function [Candidatus Lokiarchaeota archaeon]